MMEELTTEEQCISRFTQILGIKNGFCVDIGAGDGINGSNIFSLLRNGWRGLSVEGNVGDFSKLQYHYHRLNLTNAKIRNNFVYPDNVVQILSNDSVPHNFDFLSLDIDGYDYFVLDSILKSFRPKLVCCEINEKIPPPIKFTVKYDRSHLWDNSHLYGMSISKLGELMKIHGYSLINLHYVNAFLVPQELSSIFESLSPESAYAQGYKERQDRRTRYPWNSNVDKWMTMPTEDAVKSIKEFFAAYAGKYEISL